MPLFRRSDAPDIKKLQHRRDVARLIALLTDTTDEVRMSAARALGEIGDARAVEPLLAVQRNQAHQNIVRKMAAAALKQINSSSGRS
jgi:HEAT repeat protein